MHAKFIPDKYNLARITMNRLLKITTYNLRKTSKVLSSDDEIT